MMLGDARVSAMIPASDVGRAKKFYSDTLGLKVIEEMDGGAAFACGEGTSFFLYDTPSAGQAAHTLATWEVADLDAEMADLRARGVTFEEYDMPGIKTKDGVAEGGGIRASWFKDSEGNILGLGQRS